MDDSINLNQKKIIKNPSKSPTVFPRISSNQAILSRNYQEKRLNASKDMYTKSMIDLNRKTVKFEHQDFSFIPSKENEDLHSHKCGEILDIVSGNKNPVYYRTSFYLNYSKSLETNAFRITSNFSKNYFDTKIFRNNCEKLMFLKKYLKHLPKTKPANRNKVKEKIFKRIIYQDQESNIKEQEKINNNEILSKDINEFEIKLNKIKLLPPVKKIQKDMYY